MSFTTQEKNWLSIQETKKYQLRPAERIMRFVETSIQRIEISGFENVLIKDECVNPYSGTHKDRLAWDAINLYKGMLVDSWKSKESLPQFSIISSGSAAIAIGRAFRNHGFPKLKVLMDQRTSPDILQAVQDAHCELFTTDLSAQALSSRNILDLTENTDGLDLTSYQDIATDIGRYDSMGISVLSESPDYVFVPFGTGITFKKILYTAENLLTHPPEERNQRYHGNTSTLRQCHYFGATTHNLNSTADKLYAPFSPFPGITDHQIQFYKSAGYCGNMTGIYEVEERFLAEAMELASKQGILCEPSGIAGLALFLQVKDSIPKDKKILIINTGKLRLAG